MVRRLRSNGGNEITGMLSDLVGGRYALSDLFIVRRLINRARGTLDGEEFCAWKVDGKDGEQTFVFSVPPVKGKDNE